jgi:hypothetical protein
MPRASGRSSWSKSGWASRAIWTAYEAGEPWAIDRMLRLMAREASLAGLDLRPPEPEAGQQIVVITGKPWEQQDVGNVGEVVEMSVRELPSGSPGV